MNLTEQSATLDFLVLDDDSAFRQRLVLALQHRGYSCLGVSSGSEATAVLRESVVKKMILDLSMPEQTGLQVLDSAAEYLKDTQVVVLTGYGSIATATSAIKLGAMQYLTKPSTLDEILAAFNEPSTVASAIECPSLTQVEWEHLQRVLQRCDGNISKAAKLLGMHRRSLQRKLQKTPGVLK